jgi:hypothetical protein
MMISPSFGINRAPHQTLIEARGISRRAQYDDLCQKVIGECKFIISIHSNIAGTMVSSSFVPATTTSSSNVAPTPCNKAPKSLWNVVTLGFLPLFINLHERLNGTDEESLRYDDGNEESFDPYTRKNIIRSFEFVGDVPDYESASDMCDSSYYSGYTKSTFYTYSDYTSASSGGSTKDPSLHDDNSSRYSSKGTSSRSIGVKSGSTTASLRTSIDDAAPNQKMDDHNTNVLHLGMEMTRNSFDDSAPNQKMDDHNNNVQPLGIGMTRATRLVKKFSRVGLRDDDCHHTV